MDVVELTNEIFQILWWELLNHIGCDQLHQDLLWLQVLNHLETWQLQSLLLSLLLFLSLLLALLLLFLFTTG